MLGNVGAKMANKRGKMATKSAKMSQDVRTWALKLMKDARRQRDRSPFARAATSLEL